MQVARLAFNRTRMELKQCTLAAKVKTDDSFNRTRMELKLCHISPLIISVLSFNRTRMELKRPCAYPKIRPPVLLTVPEWN